MTATDYEKRAVELQRAYDKAKGQPTKEALKTLSLVFRLAGRQREEKSRALEECKLRIDSALRWAKRLTFKNR